MSDNNNMIFIKAYSNMSVGVSFRKRLLVYRLHKVADAAVARSCNTIIYKSSFTETDRRLWRKKINVRNPATVDSEILSGVILSESEDVFRAELAN